MAIVRFISIITLNVNGLNAPIDWLNGYKNKTQIYAVYKIPTSGGWEDGRELGQGDHFLLHRFIERTFERWANSTKQLLNAGRGDQAPRKAAPCLQKEVGQNIKDKKRDERGRDGDPSQEGSLKKQRSFQKHSHQQVCGEPWNLRGQHNWEEK